MISSNFPNYISQKGFDRLSTEYLELKTVERPKITELVTWAASLGDRSENADYLYGKRKLRQIDSRLRFLNKRIANAEIVDYSIHKDKVIRFGATVLVENEEGLQKSYIITGIDEIELDQNMISWRSPIAKSMLGKSVEDEILVQTPKGRIEYLIVDVRYECW